MTRISNFLPRFGKFGLRPKKLSSLRNYSKRVFLSIFEKVLLSFFISVVQCVCFVGIQTTLIAIYSSLVSSIIECGIMFVGGQVGSWLGGEWIGIRSTPRYRNTPFQIPSFERKDRPFFAIQLASYTYADMLYFLGHLQIDNVSCDNKIAHF